MEGEKAPLYRGNLPVWPQPLSGWYGGRSSLMWLIQLFWIWHLSVCQKILTCENFQRKYLYSLLFLLSVRYALFYFIFTKPLWGMSGWKRFASSKATQWTPWQRGNCIPVQHKKYGRISNPFKAKRLYGQKTRCFCYFYFTFYIAYMFLYHLNR